jgi:uncharacterized protein (TIGR03067 family)
MRRAAWVGLAISVVVVGARMPLRGSPDQKGPDAERIARLIRQLGDADFRKREAASKELTAVGEPALAALRTAAASDADPEVRHRAQGIIRTTMGRLGDAELKRLEGTWLGVAQEENGNPAPGRHKVVVAGGSSVATDPAGVEAFRCTWRVIDPTAAPRQLDLVGPDGRVFQAIYEYDGTKLRYCGSYVGRPDTFSTKPGDGRYMATLRRAPK